MNFITLEYFGTEEFLFSCIFLCIVLYKYNITIKTFFTNLFIYVLWNFVYYYSYLDTNNKSLKIIGCYYTDSETKRRFSVPDISLPIRLNDNYTKVEIVYEYFNKIYRFVEKDMSKRISSFPCYTDEQLEDSIRNSPGLLSAVLVTPDDRIDVTDLMIEYQGPMRNFYNDIPGHILSLSDINHPLITDTSVLEILDMNFNTTEFSYNEFITM